MRIPRKTTPVLARKSAPPAATPDKGDKKTPKSSGKKSKTPKNKNGAGSAEKLRKSSEKKGKRSPENEDSAEESASILKTPKGKETPKKKTSSKKKKNRAETSPQPSTSRRNDELADPFEGVPSFLGSDYKGAKCSKSKAKVKLIGKRAVSWKNIVFDFFFQKSLFKVPEAPRKSRSRKATVDSTEVNNPH